MRAFYSPRIVLIRGATAWPLFFRDGSNDQLAFAAHRQRRFSLRDGSSDKFVNLWTRQRCRGRDSDETVLTAAAEEQLMRIGKRGSVVERKPNSIGACGNGQDAIGRSLGGAVPNHEKVVVVINQFIGSGQTLAQQFAHGTDQCCVLRVKFADKARKLPLACRVGLGSNSFRGLPGYCVRLLVQVEGEYSALRWPSADVSPPDVTRGSDFRKTANQPFCVVPKFSRFHLPGFPTMREWLFRRA